METYFDLGTYSRPISTKSEVAQLWFDRGLNWLYGFNHPEAIECFKLSAEADPTCPMPYWGMACANGPYINKPWPYYGERKLAGKVTFCYEMSQKALDLIEGANEIEGALIKALVQRYQAADTRDLDLLLKWQDDYADAMRTVYATHSEDGDVVALFAEAMMVRTPWKLWDMVAEVPAENADTAEMMDVLEKGIAQRETAGMPPHPGILHMYVHTMEMSPVPEKALRASDTLRYLSPDGGHLLHMPSHIYMLCGHYYDALAVSYQSVAADKAFRQYRELGRDDWYLAGCCHDLHQMMASASYLGQYGAALEAATAIQTMLTDDILRTDIAQLGRALEAYYSMKSHVMVRFGKWQEIVDEPLPDDPDLYYLTTAMMRYARGIAYAALGNESAADAERVAFYEAVARIPEGRITFNNNAQQILGVAEAMMNGEIAYHRGNYDVAFEHLRQAVVNDDELHYTEPWAWMHPPRHALGALLLAQGHVDEAEHVYRCDLGLAGVSIRPKKHPNNVWALHGLAECLRLKGNSAELAIIEPMLVLAQARTDQPITASCACRIESDCCH